MFLQIEDFSIKMQIKISFIYVVALKVFRKWKVYCPGAEIRSRIRIPAPDLGSRIWDPEPNPEPWKKADLRAGIQDPLL